MHDDYTQKTFKVYVLINYNVVTLVKKLAAMFIDRRPKPSDTNSIIVVRTSVNREPYSLLPVCLSSFIFSFTSSLTCSFVCVYAFTFLSFIFFLVFESI